jgi:hypothetical protein
MWNFFHIIQHHMFINTDAPLLGTGTITGYRSNRLVFLLFLAVIGRREVASLCFANGAYYGSRNTRLGIEAIDCFEESIFAFCRIERR